MNTATINPQTKPSPLNPTAAAKWAAVVGDRLIPMPRRLVTARLINQQAGLPDSVTLVRDHNSPNDEVLADNAQVDLARGNVFYAAASCPADRPAATEPAKLAFVVDDVWEVVVRGEQTGGTLRALFELPPGSELLRDYESPHDVPVGDDDPAHFEAGPVFRTQPRKLVVIFVNNKEVKMPRGLATALEIKEAAIKQQVSICVDCVLYRLKADGSHSAAIRDHEKVNLECGDQFRCIAPDDNS